MKRFFFFTDPDSLETQSPQQAFGPAGQGSPGASPDRYRTTSLHSSKSGQKSPAIAVCSGTICLQEDNNGNYSIILRPDFQPAFDFPYIKYFIYKGIDSASLATANQIKVDPNIPFTERIKDDWEDPNSTNPFTDSLEVIGLGYDDQFLHESRTIFADDQPIDNFFYYPGAYQLPLVRAGEKIGDFASSDFGFEIVLERLGYEPQISLARKKEHVIEVGAIADPLNQSNTWQEDDADYFMHWHEKEQCLNYIDPCAFYGSFSGSKVFFMKAGNKKKSNTPDEIYSDLLSTFANRNKIYLDIRNDYNQSLNYYKDDGFSILFTDGQTTPTEIPIILATDDRWPIRILDLAEISSAGTTKKDFFHTAIRLPSGSNTEPLVFLSRAYGKNFRRLKRKHRVFHPKSPTDPNTEPIPFSMVVINDNGNQEFLSCYYRVNYYDQYRHNNSNNQSLAPSKAHYLNGLFRPLEMTQSLAIKENDFRFTLWHEEVLVNLSEYAGPAYLAYVGIAEDEHHITLFAIPAYFIHGGFTNTLPEAFTSWSTQSKQSSKMFLEEIFEMFQHKELRKQELEVDINGNIDQLDTIVVQHTPFNFQDNAFRENENPEDFVFLMFDKTEYANLLSALSTHPGLASGVPIWLEKDSSTIEEDENGVEYLHLVLDGLALKVNGSNQMEKEMIDINKAIFEYADF